MAAQQAQLSLHHRSVRTVYDLLGTQENDITFSVGWALAQSPALRQALVQRVLRKQCGTERCDIRLQDYGEDGGYSDVELQNEDAHIIIEAKRGWTLPTKAQLLRYAGRFGADRADKAMVVMSSCTSAFAASQNAPKVIRQIPVRYICWREVCELASGCSGTGSQAARLFVRQLCEYLRGVMELQDQQSNLVYVVALSNEHRWEWSRLTPAEFVTTKRRYFHPYGAGWPRTPPNYLGFRFSGRLQSIHHVEECELVADLSKKFKEIDPKGWKRHCGPNEQHLVYSLGPPIRPSKLVRTGPLNLKPR